MKPNKVYYSLDDDRFWLCASNFDYDSEAWNIFHAIPHWKNAFHQGHAILSFPANFMTLKDLQSIGGLEWSKDALQAGVSILLGKAAFKKAAEAPATDSDTAAEPSIPTMRLGDVVEVNGQLYALDRVQYADKSESLRLRKRGPDDGPTPPSTPLQARMGRVSEGNGIDGKAELTVIMVGPGGEEYSFVSKEANMGFGSLGYPEWHSSPKKRPHTNEKNHICQHQSNESLLHPEAEWNVGHDMDADPEGTRNTRAHTRFHQWQQDQIEGGRHSHREMTPPPSKVVEMETREISPSTVLKIVGEQATTNDHIFNQVFDYLSNHARVINQNGHEFSHWLNCLLEDMAGVKESLRETKMAVEDTALQSANAKNLPDFRKMDIRYEHVAGFGGGRFRLYRETDHRGASLVAREYLCSILDKGKIYFDWRADESKSANFQSHDDLTAALILWYRLGTQN